MLVSHLKIIGWYGFGSRSFSEKGKSASGLKVQRKENVMRDFSFDGGSSNNNV